MKLTTTLLLVLASSTFAAPPPAKSSAVPPVTRPAIDKAETPLPFTVTLPTGFAGPVVQTNGPMKIFGYARGVPATQFKSAIIISVVTVPPEEWNKGITLEKIIAGMLRGVERNRTGFTKTEPAKCNLGGHPAVFCDWEGNAMSEVKMKGRMFCCANDGRVYVLHYQDILSSWKTTFPEFEKTAKSFAFPK